MPSFFDLLAQDGQHRWRNRSRSIRNEERLLFFRSALVHFFQQTDDALLLMPAYVRRYAQLGIALYTPPQIEITDFLRVILLGEASVFFFTKVHSSSS